MLILSRLNKMISELERMGYKDIEYQMEDSHAWYFDGVDSYEENVKVEIKIEKHDNYVSSKPEGLEDWHLADQVNLK